MPAERIAMRVVREILRLITVENLPVREIARRTGKAPSRYGRGSGGAAEQA